MKIGILTFHNSDNYGAILQTFALQSKLTNLNYDAIIIDYVCKNKLDFYKIFKFDKSKSLIRNIKVILDSPFKLVKVKKISSFTGRALIKTNRTFYSSKELKDANLNYDMFICGSDQIWNYENTKFDKTYFLDFVDECNKKMSYAASFGVKIIKKEYYNEYKKLLNDIKYLSVREESGKNIVKELINIECPVVLDPTLLLNKNEWLDLIRKYKTRKYKNRYILFYTIHNSVEIEKIAEKMAKKNRCKLIRINPRGIIDIFKSCKLSIPNPIEFVDLINNAEFIITDSFHGTVFSLNLNKEFFVYLENGIKNHSRIENILKKCNLENRIIREYRELSIPKRINYNEVNEILEYERNKSIDFIKNSLGDLSET